MSRLFFAAILCACLGAPGLAMARAKPGPTKGTKPAAAKGLKGAKPAPRKAAKPGKGLKGAKPTPGKGLQPGKASPMKPAAVKTGKFELNTATPGELTSLKGIGPKKAAAIIAGRPYRAVDDLLKIKGIGPKTLAKLRPLLYVGPLKPGR